MRRYANSTYLKQANLFIYILLFYSVRISFFSPVCVFLVILALVIVYTFCIHAFANTRRGTNEPGYSVGRSVKNYIL